MAEKVRGPGRRERERLGEARRLPAGMATKIINPDGTFVDEATNDLLVEVVVQLKALNEAFRDQE